MLCVCLADEEESPEEAGVECEGRRGGEGEAVLQGTPARPAPHTHIRLQSKQLTLSNRLIAN